MREGRLVNGATHAWSPGWRLYFPEALRVRKLWHSHIVTQEVKYVMVSALTSLQGHIGQCGYNAYVLEGNIYLMQYVIAKSLEHNIRGSSRMTLTLISAQWDLRCVRVLFCCCFKEGEDKVDKVHIGLFTCFHLMWRLKTSQRDSGEIFLYVNKKYSAHTQVHNVSLCYWRMFTLSVVIGQPPPAHKGNNLKDLQS